ncbi:hypothetical protein BDQ12DRAFT_631859 [Crucibulum laeve]|uniref:Uncharacterized protein n=1 Tax=Crucibulum laeve TaxID=68775 RepID=A0A5C3M0P7_9AGAR|nr:hypothetical protein BDQ12DRAFT_631859 [Crucibulum laeve]
MGVLLRLTKSILMDFNLFGLVLLMMATYIINPQSKLQQTFPGILHLHCELDSYHSCLSIFVKNVGKVVFLMTRATCQTARPLMKLFSLSISKICPSNVYNV